MDAEMEEVEPWNEEEEQAEVDPVLEQVGFGMDDALAEFEVAQAKEAAEQHAILQCIQSEAKVEANCCFLHKMELERE